jgi:hypothetical protein
MGPFLEAPKTQRNQKISSRSTIPTRELLASRERESAWHDLRRRRLADNCHYYTAKARTLFRKIFCSLRRQKRGSNKVLKTVALPTNLEHANWKSRPVQARLSQTEEIRTRRDGREIDISSQNHNVIFEFGRGIRAENLSATRIE